MIETLLPRVSELQATVTAPDRAALRQQDRPALALPVAAGGRGAGQPTAVSAAGTAGGLNGSKG